MRQGTFEVINRLGLHARAAAKLVDLACSFKASVWLSRGEQRVNGKSIMGVLLLCGHPGIQLLVETEGPDEEEALMAIGKLFQSRFGEEG